MKRALAAATALSFCFATAAHAQDAETPTEATSSAGPTVGYYDEGGNWVPPSRGRAPDTDNCPQATWPPEPVSTSERVASSPSPLPVLFDGPCGITAADGYQVPDGVVASSWLVADLDSGDVVAMKDPHGRYRPASIIKVLLALTVIDELPLDQKVPVSAESAGQEGSAAGIGEGGDYTVEDLLTGLLLSSGNDCAHALAQALGGDELALGKVNALAKKLGMSDTRATSYSGLDGAGMSTSAWATPRRLPTPPSPASWTRSTPPSPASKTCRRSSCGTTTSSTSTTRTASAARPATPTTPTTRSSAP